MIRRPFGARPPSPRIVLANLSCCGQIIYHLRAARCSDNGDAALSLRQRLPMPLLANERWSMDFMLDTLADGRPFRVLNVVDDFTRECVAIDLGRSIPGVRVVRVLERLRALRGLPAAIVIDNGPEIAGRVLDASIVGCSKASNGCSAIYRWAHWKSRARDGTQKRGMNRGYGARRHGLHLR